MHEIFQKIALNSYKNYVVTKKICKILPRIG